MREKTSDEITELAALDDDEITALADSGELSLTDLLAVRMTKHHRPTQQANKQVAQNDAFAAAIVAGAQNEGDVPGDDYIAAATKAAFGETL